MPPSPALQWLWLCREPRPADLAAIAALEAQVASLQQQLAAADQRYQRLRQELLLREETYTKRFGAGGAGAAISVGGAAAAAPQLVSWLRGHGRTDSGVSGATLLPALGSPKPGSAGGR